MKKKSIKPVATALGTTFFVTLAASPVAQANENPFSLNELSSGYMVVDAEGKCGDSKDESEGKCGSKGEMKDENEGKCGSKDEKKDENEGKCGS